MRGHLCLVFVVLACSRPSSTTPQAAPAPKPSPTALPAPKLVPEPPIPRKPALIDSLPAERARLGHPCVLLGTALCRHVGEPDGGDRCASVRESLSALMPIQWPDCDFALEDGEAQRALLDQLEAKRCCKPLSARAVLEQRAADPRPDGVTTDGPECARASGWQNCLAQRCAVVARCAPLPGAAGRCEAKCTVGEGRFSSQNPRGASCAERSDDCSFLWRPEVDKSLGPIAWATVSGTRVGCSTAAGSCTPVADPQHPAGWKCEGTSCVAWVEGTDGPVGCKAARGDVPGRCVPFLDLQTASSVRDGRPHYEQVPRFSCRDLAPPCEACGLAYERCAASAGRFSDL